LTLTPGSTADSLSKALRSGDFRRVWNLQDVSFDSAGNLAGSASSQVQQIGSVLKSIPGVKIRITGYGETDDAGLNRANTIKSALAATGISQERIDVSGGTGNKMPTLSVEK
jgi:outer membrane protein OmpA-like peptidoglycan-associated protein